MSSSLRDGNESDQKVYFLQQHYGMPTRLLDWTTNPLVALYFSCADPKHRAVDGKVFMLAAHKLPKRPQPGGAPFGIATERREEFRVWMAHIFDWKKLGKGSTTDQTFPVIPEHFDRRISLQQGCFTFHVPQDGHWKLTEGGAITSLTVRGGDTKGRLITELAAVNIHEFSVYGDLEALARHLSRIHDFSDAVAVHSARRTDCLQFIDKDQRRLFSPSLGKDSLELLRRPSYPFLLTVRGVEYDKIETAFGTQGFGDLSFAASRRPVEKQALAW
jgi:hypothetical protein